MSRATRLQIVLELADTAESKAANAYEMANKLLREDEGKLEELCSYYDDYESLFAGSPAQMRVDDIARQRGFLIQLTEAKKQQYQVIEQRKKIAETKQAAWQKTYIKRRALSDLIDRLKADEEKSLSKKEEKMLDEWFTQTSHVRTHNSIFH